jgi:chemotaxis protein methyltransferase CheR
VRADDIAFVIALCRSRGGLKVSADKTYLIESRLNPIAREEGLAGAEALVVAARESDEARLSWRIVEAMAASETAFFRDRDVFAALRTRIVPELMAARAPGAVKIWSAACSTGQEVYSLAIMASELAQAGGAGPIELFGSDISSADLERAKSGLYSQSEVQRGLPIRMLIRHFTKEDDMWRLAADLRRGVRWRRANLIAPMEGFGPFDIVLCRNVLGLMESEARGKVLANLRAAVAPDGYLILGLTEGEEAPTAGFSALADLPGVFRPDAERRAAAA